MKRENENVAVEGATEAIKFVSIIYYMMFAAIYLEAAIQEVLLVIFLNLFRASLIFTYLFIILH